MDTQSMISLQRDKSKNQWYGKKWKKFLGHTSAENKAKCTHCNTLMCANPKNGTSHLKRHLDRCSQKVHHDIRQYMLSADTNADGSCVLNKFKYDDATARRLVMSYLVEDNRPFDTVERRGFRKMIKGFNPQYKPFSRHTARRELFKIYAVEREIMKSFILSAPGKVAMTTDNWRNDCTSEEYICVTAHFVDTNWQLQKRILRFRTLIPPYDATCISDEIILFLRQWNLEHKLLTITTDNASYTMPMVNHIKRHLQTKSTLVDGGSFFHVRCCAHIVNLIVQAGLNSLAGILTSIRNMVNCIDRSPIRKNRFFDVAEKIFKLETNKRFRLDTPVRWNSTYILLDRVLYYKNVFIYSGERDSVVKSLAPALEDWDKISYVHKFLKVFYVMTNLFSASKYPTANSYVWGVWKIQMALIDMCRSPSYFVEFSDMVRDMQAKFDKYWGEYNVALSCATILDPRYKAAFLKYCFAKVHGRDGVEERVEKIVNILRKWFEEYKRQAPFGSENVGVPTTSASIGNIVCDDHQAELDDWDTFVTEERAYTEVRKSELDLYLEEPNHPRNEDIDILDYWFKTSARYPTLALMARDLLTIPVSTVASESAFSIGGKTITPTRSSLKPKTVQALVCLRDWMLAIEEEKDDSSSSDEDDDDDEEEEAL